MNTQKAVAALAMVLFVVALSCMISAGAMGPIPTFEVRDLAKFYLMNTYNPFNRTLSVMAPAAVTAIVWDFRGLDTFFETSVFYLAIIATILLMRGVLPRPKRPKGLSIVARAGSKVVVVFILVVAAAIALHGHLTPGGGFQGGSAAAVASALLIVIFSLYSFDRLGISKSKMLAIRSLGLLGILLTTVSLLIVGIVVGACGFIMQNQPKPVTHLGFPYAIDGMLISGTPLLLNLFESLAVVAAFTLLFYVLLIPEEDVAKALRGGEERE